MLCTRLEQQEQICRETGKYAEADIVKTKLTTSQKELKNKQLEQMAEKHYREAEDMKNLYERELAELTDNWNQKLDDGRKVDLETRVHY